MIQCTPHMRILVDTQPLDFRKGIDTIAGHVKRALSQDPFSGTLFLFRNRRSTAIKVLVYDSQGFWLAHKRMSKGTFKWWPSAGESPSRLLQTHEFQALIMGGNPDSIFPNATWRELGPKLETHALLRSANRR